MPIPVILGAVLAKLAESGLGMLAGAIEAKGKEVIEDKLGVKIPDRAEDLTPEKLQELQIKQMDHEEFLIEAQVDLEKHATAQVTERWKADMASDSWLSKNIRPLALAWVLLNITILVVSDGFEIEFSVGTLALVETIASIIVGAYFLGRSTEKGISIWRKR